MVVFERLRQKLMEEVKDENESMRMVVTLRELSLGMAGYFLAFTLYMLCRSSGILLPALGAACILLSLLCLRATYVRPAKVVYRNLRWFVVLWIIVFSVLLGWDVGMHLFLLVMIMLNYFCIYDEEWKKHLFTLQYCILYLLAFWYIRERMVLPASWDPEIEAGMGAQLFNRGFVFLCMAFVAHQFGRDSEQMEKKLVQYNRKLQEMAARDELTGLWNRRRMKEYLLKRLEDYRYGNLGALSLAIGDIDYFKRINDCYGHGCGDKILAGLAELMQDYMEGKGKVCRYGGEEFLFVFEGSNGDEACQYLNTLLFEIRSREFIWEGKGIHVTMTFGLEEFGSPDSLEEAIKKADEKLYMGKEQGRNRIVY